MTPPDSPDGVRAPDNSRCADAHSQAIAFPTPSADFGVISHAVIVQRGRSRGRDKTRLTVVELREALARRQREIVAAISRGQRSSVALRT